jgi:hypothetical protein
MRQRKKQLTSLFPSANVNRAATLLPVVLLSAVCVLPARAGLEFSSKEAKASPAADAESVSKEYAFTVTGGSPVTITKLESHCACLTATASKTTWLPGEKGIVTLAMKPGGLQGEITKSVTVAVRQNGKAQESELSLTVNLPKVFSFDPPVLKWEVGSPASPKTCTVKILGGNPIRLTKVHCADVNMS